MTTSRCKCPPLKCESGGVSERSKGSPLIGIHEHLGDFGAGRVLLWDRDFGTETLGRVFLGLGHSVGCFWDGAFRWVFLAGTFGRVFWGRGLGGFCWVFLLVIWSGVCEVGVVRSYFISCIDRLLYYISDFPCTFADEGNS